MGAGVQTALHTVIIAAARPLVKDTANPIYYFGIHRQNLFFYILADAGLVLLQQLRLKLALSIPGNGDVHFPETGTQSLRTMPIPAVFRVLVVIPAVSQFLGQLCVQSVLHKLRDSFLEQVLDILYAAHVA